MALVIAHFDARSAEDQKPETVGRFRNCLKTLAQGTQGEELKISVLRLSEAESNRTLLSGSYVERCGTNMAASGHCKSFKSVQILFNWIL
ncbi:hypothetical protein ElyMa_003356000 [Elysia marginata]|uniref:Uncharacterized protein n=1 Tax=Elysia marginata TaxID=1093978 RepID=A0AAV4JH99_9GAST|nr:hypothetical protein ElyMa_003356000 [Elysia marginata]